MTFRHTFADPEDVPLLSLFGWERVCPGNDRAVLMRLRIPPPVTDLILEAKKHLQIEDQHHAH